MSLLTKHLVRTPANEPAPENVRTRFTLAATSRGTASAQPSIAAAARCPETIHLDIALPAWKQAVYLLHDGAEVEHAIIAVSVCCVLFWRSSTLWGTAEARTTMARRNCADRREDSEGEPPRDIETDFANHDCAKHPAQSRGLQLVRCTDRTD